MFITLLITFFVVVLVLYFISVSPVGGRGRKIARTAVIAIGVAAALKNLQIF
ncbi:hypothetical protein NB311A_15847 [Nitrobacter sp. Nb-311A]|uniref:hypothetical protein n=1 Tax=unclassified Nitrobacter TaxID=2620411 RepID=UPI0000686089|nr:MULTISPECIES: hypothetical protein [unclassified Nitrobacter]EAQ36755.1 hypothetical protein NB311A_15847 [Nitrobacter sp. Nb-311A]MCB1392799.1 hypothetical protein [Nitrobacter sp.]MCV0385443.1 hypothetical protein [Nitrobacter sp.]